MMNPTTITNGGSLEDCHTNFFALTDLCGIRWRKFVHSEPTTDPLNDPVLRSYARCLQVNILSVWRRIPTKKNDPYQNHLFESHRMPNTITYPPLSLKTSKELWIFWYGGEPDWSELLVPELLKNTVETGEGSWENGINYDCRSLLFKALHNLIERCLLSRGVVRLGKWFVQPCSRRECSLESGSHHISFSFGFFVHGESTVCTSMDLRIHPNVRQLTHEHLKEAALSSDYNQHPVILAPFGLAGTLTGKFYRPTDTITKKTLKEWSIFYPLLNRTESHSPPVVEVVAGGVKMCYPARYVLVADTDSESFSFKTISKMLAQDDGNEVENENKLCEPIELESFLSERVWQECVVSTQLMKTTTSPAAVTPTATGDDGDGEPSEKPSDFENPTSIKTCNCPIRESPHCTTHMHNQQLISNLMSSIPTQLDSPSSPDSSSPYSTYPPSVSPTKCDENVLPSMSPIHSFDLSNFSDTPNEVLEPHSPYMFSTEPQNTPSPNTSPSSGEDNMIGGGGVTDPEQTQAIKKIKLEMDDEDHRREIKSEPKPSMELENDDGRMGAGSECNDIDDSSLRHRPSDSAMSSSSRRSSGHDAADDSDSSHNGKHADAEIDERNENVNSNNSASAVSVDKQFESLLSGSDSLVDSQIERGDLATVTDDHFEIDTNHGAMNFDCFGTVNDDVMESAFDDPVLDGDAESVKNPPKNADGIEQRRQDAENSDDDDSGDDSDDSSENDDDSSDSDDSDDESNTPNDDVNKTNAAATEKMDADGEGGTSRANDKKDEENVTHGEKNIEPEGFDALNSEAKRAKDGDASANDGQDKCSTTFFEMSAASVADIDSANKNDVNEARGNERNQTDANENSNHSATINALNAIANDDSNSNGGHDGNAKKLIGENPNSGDTTMNIAEKKCGGDDNSEKITDKTKSHSEALKTLDAHRNRIKSEPNSRNISPQHRGDGRGGNHSADELLIDSRETSKMKTIDSMAEVRKNAETIRNVGGGAVVVGIENAKSENSSATRNLLDAAMDILRDPGDDKNGDNFGLGSDTSDALGGGNHLGDSPGPGINLDDSVNLESLDAVANLLSTDLDLDSDDHHDIFSALDNDHLDSISDSNSDDGIGHSNVKDVKLENMDAADDKVQKSEGVASAAATAVSCEETKSSSMEAPPLSCLEYKPWTNENQTNVPPSNDVSNVNVKSENVSVGDAETAEKSNSIDALVNAPLLASLKRELDCNEAMSNDTDDSNGNDYRGIELEMKRRQSPENAGHSESIVKIENAIESQCKNGAGSVDGERSRDGKTSDSIEKSRRSEKSDASAKGSAQAATGADDKSDRNNNSDKNRKGKKRTRPQYCEPTILHPRAPLNFDNLANRPTLLSHNYESLTEDTSDLNPCMLYDYSTLEAWMDHPVKRFKPNEPVTKIEPSAAALKSKPGLQDLYSKQNVVMANWAAMSNNNNTKHLSAEVGTDEVTCADTQSDYDEDSNTDAELSPSNLSELSPYGNIDILDPEDLDCFSEDFVHQQDWSYVFVSPTLCNFYGSSKYAPLSDIGLQGERQNFVYKPSWERAAAAESANKANSKLKNKNKNKSNKLNKNNKKNKSNGKVPPTSSSSASASSTMKMKSENCGGPHSNSENNVNVGNSATMTSNRNDGDKRKKIKTNESDSDSNSNDEKDQNRNTSSAQSVGASSRGGDKKAPDDKNRRKKEKSLRGKSASAIKSEGGGGGGELHETSTKSKENSGIDENSDDSSPPYYDENSNDNSDDSHHSVNVIEGNNRNFVSTMNNENDENSNGNTIESESASTSSSNTMPTTLISTTSASDAQAKSTNSLALKTSPHCVETTVKQEPTETPSQEMCDDNSTDNLENYDECETFKSKIVTVHIDHGDYDDEHEGKDGGGGKDGAGPVVYSKYKRNIETHDIIHNIEIQHYQPNDEYGDDGNYNTDSGYVDNQTDENLISHFFTFGDCDADEPDSPNESDDSDSDHSTSDDSIVSQYSPSALPPLSPYGSGPSSPMSSSSSLFGSMENIPPPVQRLPETNALILNLLLYDTSMNLFKDHNFDSCPLCVCNTGQGHLGNIRGSESGIYLPMRNNNAGGFNQSLAFGNSSLMSGGADESERNRRAVLGNSPYVDNDPIYCTCGFSAMMNRKLSHRSGLFYDDENEITGMADDPHDIKSNEEQTAAANASDDEDAEEQTRLVQRKTFEGATQLIMEYIQEQCTSVGNAGSSIMRAIRGINFKTNYFNMENAFINFVEYSDAQTVITMALDNSRLESQYRYRKNQIQTKSSNTFVNVHKWPYIKTGIPQNNKDILSFMKNMIMPILRKSFNEKYMTRLWETPSIIQGPLTWRQFHRMASSHAGQCEPQPVPSVVVGHEKDWLSVSPYAIQYWDQLSLEPYSYARDVAYIVIAPDNKFIVDEAKQFFKELSTTYEMCKLGRHSPIKGFDGILCAETPTAGEPIIDELEDLFKLFEDNKTVEILKSYVHTCLQHLVPYLTKIANDKSIFDPEPEGFNIKDFCYREKSMSSPLFQPDTPESTYVSEKEQIISFDNGNDCDMQMPYNNTSTPTPAPTPPTPTATEPLCLSADDDEEGVPPCIVIYILNPLPSGHESDDLQRLACIAMLRCYSNILTAVPDTMRSNIKLQIISMESILEIGKNGDYLRAHDEIRCLALSMFSQSRRHLAHDVNTKILTGFGTAANLQMFIKNKDCTNRSPYKLYTPPYILSGRDEVIECNEVFGAATIETPSSILYCNYCLSEDQKWLLAVATDERGELMETVTINIEVSDHEHRANTSIRRQSLQKLLDFIIGIISQTSQQWRIVIGRLGRIGHGELKAWSWLLSKSNLVKTSKQLKEVCGQCSMMYLNSCPSIVSACLLTLEPDSSFRLFSDQFTPDERFSQISMQSTLCTPTDLTCTHILVLPVNAVAQTVPSFPEHHIGDFNEEELFVSLSNGGQGSNNMNMNGMNNGGNMGSMNGNSMNGMNSMGLNGMNSMNGMGSGGLNGVNGMNSVNSMGGMNDGMNGMDGLDDQGLGGSGLNNINGLNDLNGINSVNDINNINGIDGIDGMDAIEAMDGIEGMDGMEGMEDVNMNGIDDLFGNDWDIPASDDLSLSTDNQTVATLEPKTEPDTDTLPDNLTDSMQDQLSSQLPDSLNDSKSNMKTEFKPDPDHKPNILAHLRQSIGLSGGMSGMPDKNDQQNNMGQSHNNGEQQPLAIGFMVSTAPIGKMPPWFWANCPHLENVNPVFLKSSLHLHSPLIYQNTNEYINQHFSQSGIHPLDSPFTTDTMRYILEGYNFLSWLAMDQNTNDRLSCLPFQIQVLIQLYNMVAAFT